MWSLYSLAVSDIHFQSQQNSSSLQLNKSPASADKTRDVCDDRSTMLTPSEYRKRILLVASGMTPQVVTETIYALAVRSRSPFVPTEVHLLCTSEGAMRARLLLLSEHPGWFYRLCKDYELSGIDFSEKNIHALTDCKGIFIDDIRDEEDNRNAADSIAERIRLLTADPECALHVSLAGGRKTMSFFAGYALSLFGRPQDRLSHVLVDAEFEFSPEFFYPLPQPHTIEGKDRRLLDASKATVTLAEIPFVRMRDRLPKELLSGKAPYSVVVQAADRVIGPPELVIDQAGKRIQAAGKTFRMTPESIAMLSVFARRALNGKDALRAPMKRKVIHQQWSFLYTEEYYKCEPDDGVLPKTIENIETLHPDLMKWMTGTSFSSRLSRLRRKLEDQLGPGAIPYLIDDGGTRPRKFQCTLPAHSIHFRTIVDDETVDARRCSPGDQQEEADRRRQKE